MSDTDQATKKPAFGNRVLFLMWVTLLVFGLPEMFAGSGQNWLARLDVFVLALPLYGLHFLLLIHIAVRTKRTSWSALYLFGVVFALYESWITKVIWSGYPGSTGFVMGGFGQWFGVHETLGLTLFFHPLTSFLLPLAILSRIFPAFGQHFPVPDWVFGTTKWASLRRISLVLIWGIISGHNMPNIGVYLFSWVPLLALLWVGYKFVKPKRETHASSPILTRSGLVLTILGLGLIYGVGYDALLPERLPPEYIQLLTFAAYPVLVFLIWITPKRKRNPQFTAPENAAKFPVAVVGAVFLLGLVVSLLMGGGGMVGPIAGTISLLAMVPLGVGLFLWLVLRGIILSRERNSAAGET